MLLNISFLFAICYFIEITETYHLPTNSETNYAVAKNREELINIIRSLKYHRNGNNNIDEPDTDLNDEEKEKKLQNILWLLKKNYNAQKHFEFLHNNRFHSASRLYLIKNPSVLEEYKNYLNNVRRFSKINSKKSHVFNTLKRMTLKKKLRNMRRDAMFRLGSTESDSDYIDKKEGKKLKVRNNKQVQSNNRITTQREKEEVQFPKKDMIGEYPIFKDTLELHNTNVHNSLRSDYDFRKEKDKWEDRHKNPDPVETDIKKKNTYQNQSFHKKNRYEGKTVNWDKITTKDYPVKYMKKKASKEFEYKIKPSYNRPKNEYMNKDFHSFGRTSIPFVGKRGIYDEK